MKNEDKGGAQGRGKGRGQGRGGRGGSKHGSGRGGGGGGGRGRGGGKGGSSGSSGGGGGPEDDGLPANKKRRLKFERQQHRPEFDTVLRSKEIWNKLRERKVCTLLVYIPGTIVYGARYSVYYMYVGVVRVVSCERKSWSCEGTVVGEVLAVV